MKIKNYAIDLHNLEMSDHNEMISSHAEASDLTDSTSEHHASRVATTQCEQSGVTENSRTSNNHRPVRAQGGKVIAPSTAFLSSLGNSEKQRIQTVILAEIRSRGKEGSTDPVIVMEGVKNRLRLLGSQRGADDMLRRFDENPEDALALIAHNVERQALPEDERRLQKSASDAFYQRESMKKKSATEDQVGYLRDLGYEGPVDSCLHASDLIDQIRKAGNN